MRRLGSALTQTALLAVLATACGSTAEDRLVLQFIRFDGSGITQADQVRETSADVDIAVELCPAAMGDVPMIEPFTQTIINAVFQNQEGSDILLDGYTTEISDPRLSQANITNGKITANIVGGRCSSQADKPCAVDADCLFGATIATCVHSETTVSSILLFDFFGKGVIQAVGNAHPEILGQAMTVTVNFFGSDPNRPQQTSASYTVTFADFDNCPSTTGSGGAS
jgi:hypothetical protein